MGSTINGVYTGKRGRRQRALKRLEHDLLAYQSVLAEFKDIKIEVTAERVTVVEQQIARINSEIKTLQSRI